MPIVLVGMRKAGDASSVQAKLMIDRCVALIIRVIMRYWDWVIAILAGVLFATAVAALSALIHLFRG